MAKKLFLVEIDKGYVATGGVLVQASSPIAAKRAVIADALKARKVDAIEALKLSATVPILEAKDEDEDDAAAS